jgi:hypothetical protein
MTAQMVHLTQAALGLSAPATASVGDYARANGWSNWMYFELQLGC